MGNPKRSFKWKIITAAAVVIFLLAVTFFTGRDRDRLTFFETAVQTVFAPVQDLVSSAARRTVAIVETVQKYRLLEEKNRLLKEELAYMESVRVQVKELLKENYRLRELLEFKAQTQYTLLPAEVTARNPDHWFEMLTINKGSSLGVEKGMPVVTHLGLVGNIYSVSPYSSQVLLLTDPQRGVSSMIQRSRDPGVVVGVVEGSVENIGYLLMKHIPQNANIQPGDTVISSGLGPVFPKGLVLGYVLEVGDDEYGLLKYALLEPAVNFNRLEEVFVVLEVPLEEAAKGTGGKEEGAES